MKKGKPTVVCDSKVPGLRLRTRGNGQATWLLRIKREGRDTTLTIGPAALTVEEANSGKLSQKQARDLALEAKSSDDPYSALGAKQQHIKGEPTVGALAESYYRTDFNRLRPATQRAYRIWIDQHIIPFFGDKLVSQVKRADVKEFRETFRGGQEPTGNQALAVLSHLFQTAIDDLEWIDRNPCHGVQRFEDRRVQRYFEGDAAERLKKALDEALERNPQTAFALALIATTGARVQEVLKARWSDFTDDFSIWTKPAELTKSKREWRTPVLPEAQSILETWRDHPERVSSEYLFPARRDPEKPTRSIDHTWRQVRKTAGLDGWRIHDLRHAFATHLLHRGGMSLAGVQHLLNHTSVKTTERYTHPDVEAIREGIAKVGPLFG